jgi:hypothetical protein
LPSGCQASSGKSRQDFDNQLEVVIAKSLVQKPRLIIFDESTPRRRRRFISSSIGLADEGFAVVVISSYLPEIHGPVGSHPGRAPGQDHRRYEHRRGDRTKINHVRRRALGTTRTR